MDTRTTIDDLVFAGVRIAPAGAPPLPDVIVDNLPRLAEVCRRYGVVRLGVFGSAVNGTFDPTTSDIDFLVDLGLYETDTLGRLLDVTAALRVVVGREIDVITARSRANPRFLANVQATRQTIYAAQ